MFKLALSWLLCLYSIHSYSQGSGTIIIGRVDTISNSIFVAGDSRVKKMNSETDSTFGRFCKVYSLNGYHFAIQGQDIEMNQQIAQDVCKASFPTILDAQKKHAEIYSKGLQLRLSFIKHHMSEAQFSIYVKSHSPSYATISFFGFENNKPVMMVTKFSIGDYSTDQVQVDYIVSSYMHQYNIIACGYTNEIIEDLKNPKTWKQGPVVGLKQLVHKAESFHRTEIGDTISILKVTPINEEWISKQKDCNEIWFVDKTKDPLYKQEQKNKKYEKN